jgi:hypothetical protein
MTPAVRAMSSPRFIEWSFGHYLRIAPPEFALADQAGPAPLAAAA